MKPYPHSTHPCHDTPSRTYTCLYDTPLCVMARVVQARNGLMGRHRQEQLDIRGTEGADRSGLMGATGAAWYGFSFVLKSSSDDTDGRYLGSLKVTKEITARIHYAIW